MVVMAESAPPSLVLSNLAPPVGSDRTHVNVSSFSNSSSSLMMMSMLLPESGPASPSAHSKVPSAAS